MRATPPATLPALTLLAGWLAASALPLARTAMATGAPGDLATLATHVALLALALGLRRRAASRDGSPAGRALAAWLPLLAVPLCYAELPRIAAGLAARPARGAPLHDATVAAWERALFGALPGDSPAVALAVWLPAPLVSEALHLGYLSYYALIYLPPALLWWRGRHAAHADAVRTVLLAFVLCYVVFATWPVAGPWYAWPVPPAVPDGPVRAAVQALLHAGSSRGTAFPSSHVAVSVAQTLVLARRAPGMAWPAGVATLALTLGAMYGGFHWGVDVLAGGAVGLVAGVVGPARRAPRPGAA
jgi:membrane-associated phospholipid phosphatase